MSGDVIGTATALAPGTCGELVQGMTGGVDFLVTCPINQFARATVTLRSGRTDGEGGMVTGVDHLPKTRRAVELALSEIARMGGVGNPAAGVMVSSPLPVGKGMGSSSADIAAAVGAVGIAAGVTLAPERIARIALSVEPTDGVMLPGVVLMDHRRGRILDYLGTPPPLEVIVIDRGGQVDTLEFNQIDRTRQWQEVESRTEEALDLVRAGIRHDDAELVGRGATISARAGHPPGAGPWVERALTCVAGMRAAVGVNVAHSGTVVGILLDARLRQGKPALRQVKAAFSDAESVRHFRVIGGGVRREPF